MKGMTTTYRRRRRGWWTDVPSITGGEARRLISAARERGLTGPSRVNPSLTREQAASIFEKAIAQWGDEQAIHNLIARNILREFAGRGGAK